VEARMGSEVEVLTVLSTFRTRATKGGKKTSWKRVLREIEAACGEKFRRKGRDEKERAGEFVKRTN